MTIQKIIKGLEDILKRDADCQCGNKDITIEDSALIINAMIRLQKLKTLEEKQKAS